MTDEWTWQQIADDEKYLFFAGNDEIWGVIPIKVFVSYDGRHMRIEGGCSCVRPLQWYFASDWGSRHAKCGRCGMVFAESGEVLEIRHD